jgi:anti-sigma factor RsiW
MINPEDPKWTAYVLGELNDRERTEVEKQLESSAAAREVVEEIRVATNFPPKELANESATRIDCESTSSDCRRCGTRRPAKPILRWALVGGAIAAGFFACCHAIDTINVAIATGGKTMTTPRRRQPRTPATKHSMQAVRRLLRRRMRETKSISLQ